MSPSVSVTRSAVATAAVLFAVTTASLTTATDATAAPSGCTPQAGFASCVRFAYTGADQTFTVPAGVSALRVQTWGAGGGGSDLAYYPDQTGGGGGGYSVGTLAVTPADELTVRVGQGGEVNSAESTFGGGGAGGLSTVAAEETGGSGGGYSAVFAGGQPIIVSGGGGGASPGADTLGPSSGGGGGIAGGQDDLPALSGRGGTQSAGGAAATNTGCSAAASAGSRLHGGAGAGVDGEAGGGGGGGYYGGGGGSCQPANGLPTYNGDGGGGSGFVAGPGLSNASTLTGGTPVAFGIGGGSAGGNESDYVAGVGAGGGYVNGGDGLVVLQYSVSPSAAISFAPSTLRAGAISVLTIRLSNSNTGPLGGAAVTDVYPAGLRNSDSPRATTTCGPGTVAAAAGSTMLRLTDGSIPAAGHCDIQVRVTSATVGRLIDKLPAGALTVDGGRSASTSSAVLTVRAKAAISLPRMTLSFGPSSVQRDVTSTLTIVVHNGGSHPLTDAAFTDAYPDGLINASPADVATSCGGQVHADPGGSAVALSHASIPAGSCQVTVAVTAKHARTYVDSVAAGALTTSDGVSNASAASATLEVTAPTNATASGSLANTGVAGAAELEVAAVLLAGGGLLMFAARRRRS